MAAQMARAAASVRSNLTEEAVGGSARARAAEAQAGWEAVGAEGKVSALQWRAMHGLLGGVLPPWASLLGREDEAGKRAKSVAAAELRQTCCKSRIGPRGPLSV